MPNSLLSIIILVCIKLGQNSKLVYDQIKRNVKRMKREQIIKEWKLIEQNRREHRTERKVNVHYKHKREIKVQIEKEKK